MKFTCTFGPRAAGGWTLRHSSSWAGTVEVSAASRQAALEKMRDELRYRLELCPCTGEQFQHLEIEVTAKEE